MHISIVKWLGRNLGTILLALILSLVVWISAVVTADPNEERVLQPLDIEIVGLAPDLLILGDTPDEVRITLRAPRSIWAQLERDPSLITAWIDLSGYGPGTYDVQVETRVDISPVRYEQIDPQEVEIVLERLVSNVFPIDLQISGELPVGYTMGEAVIEPEEVKVSGPESLVQRVVMTRVDLDISGAIATIERTTAVKALDVNGNPVSNVSLSPKNVLIKQPVDLQGGFKNVAVKVTTTGQVANGYRLTNISISPPTVTLFSDNPVVLDNMPGFVETLPVDLTGLDDDMEINVGLNLPQGIGLVRDPRVLVQVSVAAIEGSLTLSVPVEVTGLVPELQAMISPITVDIIVAGPLNVLDSLSPADFLVILDLTDLPVGVYQRTPEIELFPGEVRIQTILPETVEVTIELAPTATPQLTPDTPSGTPASP